MDTLKAILKILTLLAVSASSAFAQGYLYRDVYLTGTGSNTAPIRNAIIGVCNAGGLATTAASVSGNVASLTLSSNPQTAGFSAQGTITVSGFSGSDSFLNGNYVISLVSSTQIMFPLTHSNYTATSNGAVVQTVSQGAQWNCAPYASIYTNAQLTTVEQNPTGTDNYGNYSFAAAPGTYNVSFLGGGAPASEEVVTLPCVPNSTCPVSGVALSLPLTLTGNGYSNSLAGTVSAARTWYLQDVSDYFVFRTTSDTLTNKTLSSPMITSPSTTGTDSGTETLQNKTLTSPVISPGNISASMSAPGVPALVYNTAQTAFNSTVSNTTLVTTDSYTHTLLVGFLIDQTGLGSGCSGTTSISPYIYWTDPNGSSQQNFTISLWTTQISGNGTLGALTGPTFFPILIRTKASTTVQWSASYGAGTGCTTNPTVQLIPMILQVY